MIDAAKIARIEQLLGEQTKISKELSLLSNNASFDKETLNNMYSDCEQLAVNRGWSIMQMRQYYLFVVLYIFDPNALLRKLRRNGIREMVSDIMGLSSNNVSHITKCLLFHFKLYTDFRESVNILYDYIVEKYELGDDSGNASDNSGR